LSTIGMVILLKSLPTESLIIFHRSSFLLHLSAGRLCRNRSSLSSIVCGRMVDIA
jgi:hypothetical protein